MSVFEEITLSWNGKNYVIPPDDVLRCIAKIESVCTLGELASHQLRGQLPLAKISMAFAVALRHAGAKVTDDEVYGALFQDSGQEMQRMASQAIFTLQAMMIPPEHLRAPAGKAEAAGERAASSPSATSSRSG
jgi:hypothetical protein